MAEKINLTATNKLLKLIEEPPINTVFIFVCESKNSLADTLVSRCQISTLSPVKKEAVELYLKNKGVEGLKAKKTAINSSGNLRQALISVYDNDQNQQFEQWFLKWVRTAFNVKKNKEEVLELVNWSKNISTKGREVQKKFLEFSMNLFRNAMLKHYEIEQLVNFSPTTDINFEGFSKYVNEKNIEEIEILVGQTAMPKERLDKSKKIKANMEAIDTFNDYNFVDQITMICPLANNEKQLLLETTSILKRKKFLIIGSSGNLGRNISHELTKYKNVNVYGISKNRDPKIKRLKNYKFD